MTKLELCELLITILQDYRKNDILNSLFRNNHMNNYSGEYIDNELIDDLLVDFINYVGYWQGIDLGLYTKYLDSQNEKWKEINYFNQYKISNLGRVKSYKFKRIRILKNKKNLSGYLFVCLCNDKKRYNKSIHRIVLETFNPVENMSNLDVNHINGIKIDNRLENLEWCTRSENIKHGYKIGLISRNGKNHPNFGRHLSEKTKNLIKIKNTINPPNSKLTEEDVIQIKHYLKKGILTQNEIAKKFNISRQLVSKIKMNKAWKHINLKGERV